MKMDRSERAQLLEATLLRAAEEGFADIADDRGVNPEVHAETGYGTREGVDRVIEQAVAAVAEPPLTEAEEREWDRLDSQACNTSAAVRDQVIRARR